MTNNADKMEIKQIMDELVDAIENNENICIICLDNVVDNEYISATHINLDTNLVVMHQTGYHITCFEKYLSYNIVCPVCRMDLYWIDTHVSYEEPELHVEERTNAQRQYIFQIRMNTFVVQTRHMLHIWDHLKNQKRFIILLLYVLVLCCIKEHYDTTRRDM